jgi:hypothetical protein
MRIMGRRWIWTFRSRAAQGAFFACFLVFLLISRSYFGIVLFYPLSFLPFLFSFFCLWINELSGFLFFLSSIIYCYVHVRVRVFVYAIQPFFLPSLPHSLPLSLSFISSFFILQLLYCRSLPLHLPCALMIVMMFRILGLLLTLSADRPTPLKPPTTIFSVPRPHGKIRHHLLLLPFPPPVTSRSRLKYWGVSPIMIVSS